MDFETNRIKNDYFNWLVSFVFNNEHSRSAYNNLLTHLFQTEFRYSIPRDRNRVDDGIDLRWRFACDISDSETERIVISQSLSDSSDTCSVLELMVALAVRCEETIMDDPSYGNRTTQWFWKMISSLGLGSMTNVNYDRQYVDRVLTRFMNRSYDPDGNGGLFTVRNCEYDMRNVEIWYQLCWYLDSIT